MGLIFRSEFSRKAFFILPAVSLCAAANLCVIILYVNYLFGHQNLGPHAAPAILSAAWLGFYLAFLLSHTATADRPVVPGGAPSKLLVIALLAYLLAQIFFLINLPVFAWDALGKWSLTGFAFYTKGVIESWHEATPLWFEYESRHPLLVHFYAAISNSISPISMPGLKAYLYNNISNLLSALVLVYYMIEHNRCKSRDYLAVMVLFLSAAPLYENHILAYGYIEALQILVLTNTLVFGWLWIETRMRLYLFVFLNAAILACFVKLHSWVYVSIILAGFSVAAFGGFSTCRRKLTGATVVIFFSPPLALFFVTDSEFLSAIVTLLFRNSTFSVMLVSTILMLFLITYNQKYNTPVSQKAAGLILVVSLSFYPFWGFVFLQYLVGTTSNVVTGGSRVMLVCLFLQCVALVMALVDASKSRLKLAAA